MSSILLEAKDVKKYFPVTKGIMMRVKGWIKAVDGVNFTINQRETFSLVGESGCGKTTTAKLILFQEKPTGGSILFKGEAIQKMAGERLKTYRRSIQAVFQDPYSSLNPRMRVGHIISEPMMISHALSKNQVKCRVKELLDQVGLAPESVNLYPHEFSGGQRQRIAIARALSTNPQLLVLDEPVSALDVSIRAELINLLKDIQIKMGLTYLLIAHHLAVVKHMSTRIAVMYLGRIVEVAESEELHSHPLHPYTVALLSASLPAHPDDQRVEIILPGEVPSPISPPSGCRFHPRCSFMQRVCSESEPALIEAGTGHWVACHFHDMVG